MKRFAFRLRRYLLLLLLAIVPGYASSTTPTTISLAYIDTSFENASPLRYEPAPDGMIHVHLLYDHQRSSPNCDVGHCWIL